MLGPIVGITSHKSLRDALLVAAQQLGHAVVWADENAARDVVAWLAAHQPDLIVLQADDDAAIRSLLAAKTSPATRRMPVLAIAPIEYAAHARDAGADAVVDHTTFCADTAVLIRTHRRPDQHAAIAAAAQLPLPARAREAVAQFNAGEYFEQHETFEEVWRAEPGPIRQLYQGILQVGVAYLQIQRRNYDGARKIFLRAQQYLHVLPDVCQGIDVARLRADAYAALAELERLGPAHVAEFPSGMMRPVHVDDRSQQLVTTQAQISISRETHYSLPLRGRE